MAAALDGGAGVADGSGPEALKASEIPPWAPIDNQADSTHNPIMVLIAPLLTSPLRPDIKPACE